MIETFGYVESVPAGTIIIWDGVSSSIPSGWALCDGNNGAPDLEGKYIAGDDGLAIGNTGGSEFITLSIGQMPRHRHVGTTDIDGAHTHNVPTDQTKRQNYTGHGLVRALASKTQISFGVAIDPAGTHNHTIQSQTSVGANAPIDIKPLTYRANFIMKL